MFIVYMTINRLTSEYYIGVHKTQYDVFDGYYGSGRRIVRSVKKYGKDNFIRSTLHQFSDDEEDKAFDKEEELLVEKLNDPLCLNLGAGGKGGSNFKGCRHSEETRRLLSHLAKDRIPYRPTVEDIENAKATRLKKYHNAYFSDESLQKISIKSRLSKTDDVRSKVSKKLIEHYQDAENRQRHSERLKTAYNTPETRLKHKLAMQGNNLGKIWMVNNTTRRRTRIDSSKKQEFEMNGYVEGYKFNAE